MALASDRDRIAHLLRRAGFGAGPAELDSYVKLGFDGAVDRLINYESVPETPDRVAPEAVGIEAWWLEKMLHTSRPLQEKMTLYWHGHLTSALKEVKDPNQMLAQNQFFRANALGSFGDLLHGISRDGAMIEYLDLKTNRKSAPNENYGRELMELFTLGIGNYSEQDVKEAARAFTGWTATPDGRFFFNQAQHDSASKTLLGQSGDFDGDAVSAMLASHPKTAQFVSRKLFRFFAYSNPEPAVIDGLAQSFLDSGGSIKALVERIFRSPEFSSEQAYRALVKSPTELLVGTLRTLGAETVPPPMAQALRLLGQELFNPPSVAGWFGGRGWINAATLLGRFNLLERVLALFGGPGDPNPPLAALFPGAATPEARVQRVLELLLDGDVTADERATLQSFAAQAKGPEQIRGLLHFAMVLPAYQLN